jgi:hypothetical protein
MLRVATASRRYIILDHNRSMLTPFGYGTGPVLLRKSPVLCL